MRSMIVSTTHSLYGYRWHIAAKKHLRAHPLCAMCASKNVTARGRIVDHITPHRGDLALFWNAQNWQSLCASCHSSSKQQIERRGYSTKIGIDGYPVDERHPSIARDRGGQKKF